MDEFDEAIFDVFADRMIFGVELLRARCDHWFLSERDGWCAVAVDSGGGRMREEIQRLQEVSSPDAFGG